MKKPRDAVQLSMPVMLAFRTAFVKRDATKVVEVRDDSGRRVVSRHRTAVRDGVKEDDLRRDIRQDVETLLNTVNLSSTQPLDGLEEVERSILNYGIPDLVHRTIDEVAIVDVVEELETALTRFEPRIVSRSLEVRRDESVDPAELKVRFVIGCDVELNAQPVEMQFLADIALDSEKIQVSQA